MFKPFPNYFKYLLLYGKEILQIQINKKCSSIKTKLKPSFPKPSHF